ncbi:hypothetical protein E2C01_038037 [Portunus trituberculatus]|uniref:Uncharacterized protein n=1 Tax=Portunus trituberculatus TaxID=210409 RepID=A0A5B7FIU1_PORTR|nr:hypothetical protein [Portunus trituberculatus]
MSCSPACLSSASPQSHSHLTIIPALNSQSLSQHLTHYKHPLLMFILIIISLTLYQSHVYSSSRLVPHTDSPHCSFVVLTAASLLASVVCQPRTG